MTSKETKSRLLLCFQEGPRSSGDNIEEPWWCPNLYSSDSSVEGILFASFSFVQTQNTTSRYDHQPITSSHDLKCWYTIYRSICYLIRALLTMHLLLVLRVPTPLVLFLALLLLILVPSSSSGVLCQPVASLSIVVTILTEPFFYVIMSHSVTSIMISETSQSYWCSYHL